MADDETPRGDWRDGLPEGVDRASLPAIRRVQHDSRAVEAGDLFVCIPGERADGHDFAATAVEAGAVALIASGERAEELSTLGVPVIGVRNPRAAMASVAAAHEGYPGRALSVIGITGTDGKSTTAFLTLAALEAAGLTVGLLSTIETRIAGEVVPIAARLTTQEAPVVQRLLGEMVEAGCTHAVVEATSHGLALHRLDHCSFDVGVLTNITPDHLDFHGSFEAYRKAKGVLFEMLNDQPHGAPQRTAVLNHDEPNWEYFAGRTKARVVTYGVDNDDADVRAEGVMGWSDGSTFSLTAGDDSIEASVRLPGEFNVENATAAITAAAALGLEIEAVASGVAACEGVPGRMERIGGAPLRRWLQAGAVRRSTSSGSRTGERRLRAASRLRSQATCCCWRARDTSARSSAPMGRMSGTIAPSHARRLRGDSANAGCTDLGPCGVALEAARSAPRRTRKWHARGSREGCGDARGRAEAARRGVDSAGTEGRRGPREDGCCRALRQRYSHHSWHGDGAAAVRARA
jgi:UDP-N-acetylmuramyl-tripeptide synthetase